MPTIRPHKIFAAPIGTATPNTIYTQQGAKPACQQHISTEFSQLLLAQLVPQTRMPAIRPHKIFAAPIGTATPNNIYTQHDPKPARRQHIHTKFSQLLLAQLPRTQFTHSKAPNPHASNTSTQNFRSSYWHSYPEQHLHTARPQTRMPATHPHKIFAAPIGTATPNNIYTQQGPKPACQQHIHTKFSQLLLAQLPRNTIYTQHGPKPACQQYVHTKFSQLLLALYPEHHLHTARCQTRTPATHQHRIFAAPIGPASGKTIYTQQGPKPACQQHIHTKFSQLLLAQLPRTQFTHSTAPNPHASNTSTQNFRSSYWHSYPEQHLHTARPQTRMPATHPHKIFAAPIGTATPNNIYTQQGSKPACQQYVHTKFSQLLLAQLPRTTFTHSTAPNPHASNTSTQNFCSSYWHSYPEQHLHTARPQTRMPATHPHKFSQLLLAQLPQTQFTHSNKSHACHAKATAERRSPKRAKAYIRPRASAPSPTPATQKQRQSGGAQNAPKRTSDPVQVQQVPRLPRKSSGKAAETKTRQSVHQTPRQCSKSHACHAKAAAERRRPKRAKAYIRPRSSAPSATPATQKQRQSGGDLNAPKRTSDPVQAQQVPRLPRKSSGRAAETKTRQSVHQTPCKCSKRHANHAKAAAERRRPKCAKAYIRPRASAPSPTPATQSSVRAAETKTRQSVHQTPCKCSKRHACHAKAAAERRRAKRAKAYIRPRAGAASPTPATQKQRQSSRDQNAPKRTSDPVQVLQAPRLPRKSSGRAAETKTRQSVHQTPCRCSKSHACHAKAAAERRRPKRAKAYIRPRAGAASPTPATQKQRQSGGDQNAPKRTSDPPQVLQVPRLPRKSSGRAAETKTRQSVHQTPCKCSKRHACHAKAAAERRRPKRAKAYIRPRASAPSPTPATQKQRQSGGDQNAPKRTSDPAQAQQIPRLPRKRSGRAAETKTRQSVHQTPRKCSKSHACHAKAAAERRRPKRAKAYIRPRASAPSATPATQKQRQSGGDQNAPKRTSDPVQVQQVPRLPRKSSGRAAETKTRQSVHQTPCKCSKSHACHAKAAAERRRPKRAKAYIRPRASAQSATPATQKQRQSGGDQNAPKRTSDPVQVQQVPRLPRKSNGRAAETKTRQSVHQTPCKCSKSHACHAKAAAKAASSCVMSSCVMSSCVISTCAMSS